jgi:site-specific recombinase XerD
MRTDTAVRDHLLYLKLSGAAAQTIKGRRQVLRDVAAHCGGKPLLRLTSAELLGWRRSLRVRPDSVATYASHLRAFYRWAVEMELTRLNPAARIPVPRRARRTPRPIGEPDVATAMRAAPRDIRLMLALAGWLGLRCCELHSLQWESVSLQGRVLIARGKGDKERVLPLSDWLLREFERYGVARSGYVFRRRDGGPGPVTAQRIGHMISRYLRDLGIDATAHQWRHRFATQLLDRDANLREVQEALGHEQLATVAVYTLVSRRSLAAAMAALPVPDDLAAAA